MPPPCSDVIESAHRICEQIAHERLSKKQVHVHGTSRVEKRARVVTGTGEAQLAHLFALLDSFGMKRSHVQVQLHAGMAGSLLIRSCFFSHISAGSVMQRIFCNDSDAAMKLSMQRYKITSCRQQFMAITPRRFGYCYRINVQNHACTARRPLFPCLWRRSRSPSPGHRPRSSLRGAARAVCCYSK